MPEGMRILDIGIKHIKCPCCGGKIFPSNGKWACNWCPAKSTDEKEEKADNNLN